MIPGLDRDEDGHAKANLVLVDQSDPLGDDPFRFEPLNAFPARGRGETDQAADLRYRMRGILLEHGQNFAVDGIHSRNSAAWRQIEE